MAHFKTAYLRREMVLNVKVSTDLKVGDLVSINSAGDTITASTLSEADYIIAQSDITMNRRDYSKHEYEYSDVVAASTDVKKVAVFPVYESDDIIVTGNETTNDDDDE